MLDDALGDIWLSTFESFPMATYRGLVVSYGNLWQIPDIAKGSCLPKPMWCVCHVYVVADVGWGSQVLDRTLRCSLC